MVDARGGFERLEVLGDGGQVELVARASETSQAHALEAMVDLQVREPHLYFLRAWLDCSNSGEPFRKRA